MFDLPFAEIAPIAGHSPAAARQLASRARRRVRGAATVPDADLTRQRAIVDAFLAASRGGDFDALLALLDPDEPTGQPCIWAHRGRSAVRRPWPKPSWGVRRFAQPALVNGALGAVWAPRGRPRVVFGFTITRRRIVEIDLLADPDRLRQLDLAVLKD
jgi:hypothetical protein